MRSWRRNGNILLMTRLNIDADAFAAIVNVLECADFYVAPLKLQPYTNIRYTNLFNIIIINVTG